MSIMSNMSTICETLGLPMGTAVTNDAGGKDGATKGTRSAGYNLKAATAEGGGGDSHVALLAAALGSVGLVVAGVEYQRTRRLRSLTNGQGGGYDAVPSEPI